MALLKGGKRFFKYFYFAFLQQGTIHLWHPVDGEREGQVKNGQNSDGSGWLQGGGAGAGGDSQILDVQNYD